MIDVLGLTKRFGALTALDEVSFQARNGRILALLGPNGAGKSTCLRILYTVLRADAGEARIGGIDVRRAPLEARRRLGVLPHRAGLYPQLTARENIAYFGRLHGVGEPLLKKRVDALVERLALERIADRKAKHFSQGERTKVALARALVHEPSHLLLDEPTSGLDVMAARELRQWLGTLREQGRCIVLSSHIMQEVGALADDLVIVANGRVAAAGTADDLAERFPGQSLEEIFVDAVGAEHQ